MCRRSVRRLESSGAEDVVRHHQAAEPLERKLTDGLDRDSLLDGLPNSRTDEDLTGLGFIAEARRHIGHCPNRRVIPAALKTNCSQRGKAMRNADPEPKVVTKGVGDFNYWRGGRPSKADTPFAMRWKG